MIFARGIKKLGDNLRAVIGGLWHALCMSITFFVGLPKKSMMDSDGRKITTLTHRPENSKERASKRRDITATRYSRPSQHLIHSKTCVSLTGVSIMGFFGRSTKKERKLQFKVVL